MKLREKNPALLLIDFQKGFEDEDYWGGNRNNPNMEINSQQILFRWRELNLPIFHIKHSSKNPKSKLHESNIGFEIMDEVKPISDEAIIIKNVNSAFIGTDLKTRIDDANINSLIIIGMTTNHCVSTSARMAGNFGYDTILISDAIATFDRIGIKGEKFSSEIIHQTSLASLNEEFAEIYSTQQLLNLI